MRRKAKMKVDDNTALDGWVVGFLVDNDSYQKVKHLAVFEFGNGSVKFVDIEKVSLVNE